MPTDQTDRAELDQAAEQAAAAAAQSYLAETRGRVLNQEQRAMRDKAARLARYLDRNSRKDRR